MRHLGANFYKQFRNKDLMNLFKRLCNKNQQRKFDALWKILDERTQMHRREEAKKAGTSADQAPEALPQLPTDGPSMARKMRAQVKYFSDWIEHKLKEKWSLLHDRGGARYDIMTTNLAEVYNWVMRGARCLPLVGIVEAILRSTIN